MLKDEKSKEAFLIGCHCNSNLKPVNGVQKKAFWDWFSDTDSERRYVATVKLYGYDSTKDFSNADCKKKKKKLNWSACNKYNI